MPKKGKRGRASRKARITKKKWKKNNKKALKVIKLCSQKHRIPLPLSQSIRAPVIQRPPAFNPLHMWGQRRSPFADLMMHQQRPVVRTQLVIIGRKAKQHTRKRKGKRGKKKGKKGKKSRRR